jgi:hypothetical protein
MPDVISRMTWLIRPPWNTRNSKTSASKGVAMRCVKSCPEIGKMLNVGFSDALAPMGKLRKFVLGRC